MIAELAAVLVTLLTAGPLAWWFTSPRRVARRVVRRLERIGAEVRKLMAAPAASPKPAVPACASPPTARVRRVVVLPCSPLGSTTT
ncbi:MAG: hypothetical protein ABIQ18_35380, partial [Umezawaea sp.]